jgi:hypothetical protein
MWFVVAVPRIACVERFPTRRDFAFYAGSTSAGRTTSPRIRSTGRASR